MKKLLLILLCLPMIGFGQDKNLPLFALKSGCSISNIIFSSKDVDIDKASRAGFMFGISKQFGRDKIRSSGELLFNQRGNKENIHFNYLDLGIKANFLIFNKIALNIGPSFSYLLNGEWNEDPSDGTDGGVWVKLDKEDMQDFNLFGYSASAGLSYEISKSLGFGYSYNLMLNPVVNENTENNISKMSSASSTIYILLTIN